MTVHQLYSKLTKLQLENNLTEALRATREAQISSKEYYDRRHTDSSFDIGTKVWVYRKDGRAKKLSVQYDGFYTVIDRNNDIYELKHTTFNKTIKRHVSFLKKFTQRDPTNEDPNDSSSSSSTSSYARRTPSPVAGPSGIVAMFTLSTILGGINAQVLRQESLVIWHRADKTILTGSKSWDLTIAMKSPCTNLGISDPNLNNELYSACQRLFER